MTTDGKKPDRRLRGEATSPRNLATAERRAKAWRLRKAGIDIYTIARRLKVSGGDIRDDLSLELKSLMEESRNIAESERALELARLDDLHAALWDTVFPHGEQEEIPPLDILQLKAIDKIIKVMERRAKLLGLDAPVKAAFTKTDGSGFTLDDLNEARKLIYGTSEQ